MSDFAPEPAPAPVEPEPPPAEGDWRADPLWTLAWYDAAYYEGQTPPATPTSRAELAQPPVWASLYGPQARILATWYRGPVRPR